MVKSTGIHDQSWDDIEVRYHTITQGFACGRTTGREYSGLRRPNNLEMSAGLDIGELLLSPNHRAGIVCCGGLRWLQANRCRVQLCPILTASEGAVLMIDQEQQCW